MTHVYVIQAEGGPVKVGVAADPVRRLRNLRTGTPLPLTLAHVEPIAGGLHAVAVERAAHTLLGTARAHGEWFTVSVEEARAAIHEAIVGLGFSPVPPTPPEVPAASMNAAQCRMARAALQIGVRELAAMAKVSPSTIARLEAGEELKERTIEAVQAALEAAGVAFTNGGEPGVKLARKTE